ncbi:MAG: ATP-binding cassette domain-containing protein [Rickettsiales bacterium]|nr:MAG: ATP-binding cassette domain-containing protein [Rickettsiales bacterium]
MLKLQNIIKTFAQLPEAILKNINLQIDANDYCIILGSNGSGKSTLFKIISGEYKADSGAIILHEQNITNQPTHMRARDISCVAQDITKGTISEMTLLENIALSNLRGQRGGFNLILTHHDKIAENLSLLNLDLEKYLNSKMSSLSGGQRQSIATLMAMIPKPSLLLLDEHTSALDPISKQKIMDFTDNYIKENKITTLMITHNIKDALTYGNRLIIMNHGNIIYDVKDKAKSQLTEQGIMNILYENGGIL